jgi:hypothetical protein
LSPIETRGAFLSDGSLKSKHFKIQEKFRRTRGAVQQLDFAGGAKESPQKFEMQRSFYAALHLRLRSATRITESN